MTAYSPTINVTSVIYKITSSIKLRAEDVAQF